jgi:hydrogenase maturation factor
MNFENCLKKDSKMNLIIKTIDYLQEGIIIQSSFTKILNKIEKILKKNLEKKYNIIKFYGNLTSIKRNKLIENLDPKNDILLLSSKISTGLNLNMFDYLINIEIDVNFASQIQQEKRIIRVNNTTSKVVFNLITSSNVEKDRLNYILVHQGIEENLINENKKILDINDIKDIISKKENHEELDFLSKNYKILINKNKFL